MNKYLLDQDTADMVVVQPGQYIVWVNTTEQTVEQRQYTGLQPLCTRTCATLQVTVFDCAQAAARFAADQRRLLQRPRLARALSCLMTRLGPEKPA